MNVFSNGSSSSSSVCGLGTLMSSISSSLARSREMCLSIGSLISPSCIAVCPSVTCAGPVPCCCPVPSLRPRQPQPEALFECVAITEVCQGDILRHEAGGMDQYALVVALPAALLARDQLVNLGV